MALKALELAIIQEELILMLDEEGYITEKKLNSSNCPNVNSNKDFSNQYEENNDTYSIIKIDSEYEYFVDKKEEWLLPELEKFYRNQIVPRCANCFVFILGFICPLLWLINVFHLK